MRVALGAPAPTWSSFPASKVVPSFRAHSAARNRLRALGLCRPMVPRGRAAIPRVVRVRRCRHPPDRGGRHSPGQRRGWPPFPGPRRWPRSTRREAHSFRRPASAESGRSTTSTAADDAHDASASGRARRGYQRCAATWGLLGTGAAVLRASAHRRAGVERAEPIARRSRARLIGSCSCLMQCLADELDLFTGFA